MSSLPRNVAGHDWTEVVWRVASTLHVGSADEGLLPSLAVAATHVSLELLSQGAVSLKLVFQAHWAHLENLS